MFKAPERVQLGEFLNTTVDHIIFNRDHAAKDTALYTERTIMGFRIPEWQRPLVWTRKQQIAFIESAWKGVSLGTFSYTANYNDLERDRLLIDGQQRMKAFEDYFLDAFEVFGAYWSGVDAVNARRFTMTTIFSCYRVSRTDEEFLKQYYNLLNFSGTAHKETERAV